MLRQLGGTYIAVTLALSAPSPHSRFFVIDRLASTLLHWALLGAVALGTARSADLAAMRDNIRALLPPPRTEWAALAPDGRHLAYTVQEAGRWQVTIVAVDNPRDRRVVGLDVGRRDSGFFGSRATAMTITFFHWITAERLVIAARAAHDPESGDTIFAIDRQTGRTQQLADPPTLAVAIPSASYTRVANVRPNSTNTAVPRIVGWQPEAPGFLLVEGTRKVSLGQYSSATGTATGLVRVNCETGEAKDIFEQILDGRMLYDQAGNPRLLLHQPPDVETQEYARWQPGQVSRTSWAPLGDTLGPDQGWEFRRTTRNCYTTRSFPLGFDYNPEICYIASNVGRDTYGIYAVNLTTNRRLPLQIEAPGCDLADPTAETGPSPLVWDRSRRQLVGVHYQAHGPATHWIDPELAAVEKEIANSFPRRTVELQDWDDARQRFLVRVSGVADPGRFYLYERATQKTVQFARQQPTFDPDLGFATREFDLPAPTGGRLTGRMTLPRAPLINPPPLLVCLNDGPMRHMPAGYDREMQIFAAMGFVVVRLNYRGSAGLGLAFQEPCRNAPDRAPLADVRADVAWVAQQQPVDRRRVALYGYGYGGYLALRGVQLFPQEFRCALAREAPLDLPAWLEVKEAKIRAQDLRDYSRIAWKVLSPPPKTGASGGPGKGSYFVLTDNGYVLIDDDYSPGSAGNPSGGGGGMPSPPDPLRNLLKASAINSSDEHWIDFDGRARRAWFTLDDQQLKEASPLTHPETLVRPVMLIVENNIASATLEQARQLHRAMRSHDLTVELLEHARAESEDPAIAPEAVYTGIQEFFNLHLYNYTVKVGAPTVKGEP